MLNYLCDFNITILNENIQNSSQTSITLQHGNKGIVYPNIKIISSFTHPHVIQNLYDFLLKNIYFSFLQKKRSSLQVFYEMRVNK